MSAMPQTEAAMRRHMMAEPPAGHGMPEAEAADMPMSEMRAMHDRKHGSGAGHDHQMMKSPIRFAKGSDTTVEGWGMPFFGPFAGDDGIGRDFDGEFFSPKTDFLFDWFKGSRPFLYQHTWDARVGTDPMGDVVNFEKRKDGIWVQAQLDLRSKWYEAIRELIGEEALSFSSGAYPAGVVVAKSGEILRWPWVELTATPTPANPYASIAAMKSLDWPPLVNVEPSTADEEVDPLPRRLRIVGVSKPS